MTVDPGLVPLAFLIATALGLLTVPLAAAVFFGGAALLLLNSAPLPRGFLPDYSLAMRLNSPALISIPLFALAGDLAIAAGIAERLLNVADAVSGRGRLGAGARPVLGSALFASVSGVGPAAAAAEGKRLIPEMIEGGFSREAAAGFIASTAGLAIIIPASIPLTVYAATVGIRTNIVFAASFVPGLAVALALLLTVSGHSLFRRRHVGARPVALGRRLKIIADARWALLMPVLVLSSLFTGFFTAPEAAAFSCAYAALVGRYCHRELTRKALSAALGRTVVAASAVLLIAGTANLFLMLLESSGFTQMLGESLFRGSGGRIGAIILINMIVLTAGCFLDMPALITMITPLLLPLAGRCGMSPAHFGAVMAVNIAIGLVTPPQAHNLTAAAELAETGMWRTAAAAIPCLAAMLACLALVSFLPELSLWFPRLLGWEV